MSTEKGHQVCKFPLTNIMILFFNYGNETRIYKIVITLMLLLLLDQQARLYIYTIIIII